MKIAVELMELDAVAIERKEQELRKEIEIKLTKGSFYPSLNKLVYNKMLF